MKSPTTNRCHSEQPWAPTPEPRLGFGISPPDRKRVYNPVNSAEYLSITSTRYVGRLMTVSPSLHLGSLNIKEPDIIGSIKQWVIPEPKLGYLGRPPGFHRNGVALVVRSLHKEILRRTKLRNRLRQSRSFPAKTAGKSTFARHQRFPSTPTKRIKLVKSPE